MIQKKYLLIFATSGEAKETVSRFKAKPLPDNTGFFWNDGIIILSGIGLHAAQICTSRYCIQCDEVLNIGFAGALHTALELGEISMIKKVDKYVPHHPFSLDPNSIVYMQAGLPTLEFDAGEKNLITSDFPIHDVKHKMLLAENADLIDMEGYGVAYAAQHYRKPCRIWKIVSDFSSAHGRNLIIQNMRALSKKIADHMEQIIYESSCHS